MLFVSLHQYPWYPGTGRAEEIGTGPGRGFTLNVPLPSGSAGAVYRRAFGEIVGPKLAAFAPTWVLVSAGFDGHRLDPLAELGLSAGDYAVMAETLRSLAPAGRVVAFLEGGYHLDALRWSVAATAGGLLGAAVETEPLSDGPVAEDVLAGVRRAHGLDRNG